MTYKNHSRIAPVDLKVLAGRTFRGSNRSIFQNINFNCKEWNLQDVITPDMPNVFQATPDKKHALEYRKSVRPILLYIQYQTEIPEVHTSQVFFISFFISKNLEFSGKAVTKCCLNIKFARNQYRIFCQEGSILFFVICISTLFVYLFCLFFVFTFCYSV